jgi:hypothetical protein
LPGPGKAVTDGPLGGATVQAASAAVKNIGRLDVRRIAVS